MANLNEAAVWEAGIYQIETTDPVVGGAPNPATGQGLSNIPHLQLARRTVWLKDAFDALGTMAALNTGTANDQFRTNLQNDGRFALRSNNLSDLANAATARTNLGATALGSTLFTLADAAAGRTALGLGTMATLTAGTSGAQFRTNDQNDGRFTQRASNLSDLANPATARTNLGLGTMATQTAGPAASQFRNNGENATVFAPVTHTHSIAQVTDLQNQLNSRAPLSHGHAIADVSNLQTELNGKAPTSHTHAISQVTGLQNALDGKAPTSHTHAISQVTGLQSALDAKANLTAFPASLGSNGYQSLPSGLIIQWGLVGYADIANTTPVNFNFPIAFPNGLLSVVASLDTTQDGAVVHPINLTLSGGVFNLREFDTRIIGGNIRYIAIGR